MSASTPLPVTAQRPASGPICPKSVPTISSPPPFCPVPATSLRASVDLGLDVCEGVRAAARRILSDLGDDSAIFHLIDTVPDPYRDVPLSAVRAICEVDDNCPFVRHV